jgi:hypothetical protein
MNCDCTRREQEQYEKIEELWDRIRELEQELEQVKQLAWHKLTDAQKDEAIKKAIEGA